MITKYPTSTYKLCLEHLGTNNSFFKGHSFNQPIIHSKWFPPTQHLPSTWIPPRCRISSPVFSEFYHIKKTQGTYCTTMEPRRGVNMRTSILGRIFFRAKGEGACDICAIYYFTWSFKFKLRMSFLNLMSFRTRCKLKKIGDEDGIGRGILSNPRNGWNKRSSLYNLSFGMTAPDAGWWFHRPGAFGETNVLLSSRSC